MTTPNTAEELLTLHKNGLVKVYQEYDGSGRPFRVYSTHTNAVTGSPCVVTEYIYIGITTQIKGRKEGYTTWDATWIPDSAFSSVPDYKP